MKILVLEDNRSKLTHIETVLKQDIDPIEIQSCSYFGEFIAKVNTENFDLIVADLLVPYHNVDEPHDISLNLVETIRVPECTNFNTPIIAVTNFSDLANQNYEELNKYDINVITYDTSKNEWEKHFLLKVKLCVPPPTFDFVIFCALEKEADAYKELGYDVDDPIDIHGIQCRNMSINGKHGTIISPPRMGLVNAAILCSRAIDLFSPKVFAMSGICAGVKEKTKIYDIIIPEICHQHDAGKWTETGFVPELYSVQLHHKTRLTLSNMINKPDFIKSLKEGITIKKSEIPDGEEELDFGICLAPTSSGSAVVANETTLEEIKAQHRKMTAFEMESYSLYEACRQALSQPIYFSAKSVVDNGDQQKSDHFHRIACSLSAKCVHELIKELLKSSQTH